MQFRLFHQEWGARFLDESSIIVIFIYDIDWIFNLSLLSSLKLSHKNCL